MYDMKWVINYSYYLTYSINKLHCLPNVIINSKNIIYINMITYLLLNPHTYDLLVTNYLSYLLPI
jgi:hypothetical protein